MMFRFFYWLKGKAYRLRHWNLSIYLSIYRIARPLVCYFHRKRAEKNYRNPTEEMKQANRYFCGNRERIDYVCGLLEDEASRIIYRTMIEFRCTQDYKLFSRIKAVQGDKLYLQGDRQYFDNEFFKYHDGECLIDCGACDGDTIASFKKQMKRRGIKNIRVVAFEPDKSNCSRIRKREPDAFVIQAGVWNSDTILRFSGGENAGKTLTSAQLLHPSESIMEVNVKSIDRCPECEDATLIKMDIEGAEIEALKGAENLIRSSSPKLAICIYHSDEDMIRIAEWIHQTVPEYRLYVRQHTDTNADTVLYCMAT